MNAEQTIDHTRGLCGTPDVPNDTPRSIVEKIQRIVFVAVQKCVLKNAKVWACNNWACTY